jgi:hypothetical protein
MPSILEEILEWSKARPPWQQDALRRLVALGDVDDDAVRAYAAACAGEEVPDLEPLAQGHLRANEGEKKPVTVTAIRDGKNVNALMGGEALTFAAVGLTIVYGDKRVPHPRAAWDLFEPRRLRRACCAVSSIKCVRATKGDGVAFRRGRLHRGRGR